MHSPLLEPFPGIVCREWLLLQINWFLSSPGSALCPWVLLLSVCVCPPAPTGPAFGRWCFQVYFWDISCSWNSCTSLGYPPATWSYREVSSGHGQFSDDLVPLTSLDGYFWLCCLCCREIGLGWARGRKHERGFGLGFSSSQGPTKVGAFILQHSQSTYWMSGPAATKLWHNLSILHSPTNSLFSRRLLGGAEQWRWVRAPSLMAWVWILVPVESHIWNLGQTSLWLSFLLETGLIIVSTS